MIVTIDGPAGSGKSTTARGAAAELPFVYLDTGAMYRAVALGFLRADAEPSSEDAEDVLPSLDVDVQYQTDETMRVFLDGEDVTGEIRSRRLVPWSLRFRRCGPSESVL